MRSVSTIASSVASSRSFSVVEKTPLPFWSTSTVWRTRSKSAVPTTKSKTFRATLPPMTNSTSLVSLSLKTGSSGGSGLFVIFVAVAQLMR